MFLFFGTFLLFFLFPLCFPCLPSTFSLKGGPGVPGVSAFPAGCRFGPLLPGLHGPKPGLRHALCSLHERGGCSRCGGDVPAAPSSRCFRHRDTGVPNAELLSHRCPFPFPFPFCPLPTAGRKPRHKQDTCIVVQEVALSYAPAFWVICFYLLFLKKAKKKGKKGFPITYSFFSPTKLPARTKFFQNLHFDRKVPPFLLSLCLVTEGRVCLVDRRGAMALAGQGKGCWRQNRRNERDRGPS